MPFKSEISDFKLLVILPNNTEVGKTVSATGFNTSDIIGAGKIRRRATESFFIFKCNIFQSIFQAPTISRYILVDVFQPYR